MKTIEVRRAAELGAYVGATAGPGAWWRIDQSTVDLFAEATGDRQWIHVDPRRAFDELGGPTIAHGYLLLSLIPILAAQLVLVREKARVLNYGSDRVRYIAQVPTGSSVRLSQAIVDVTVQDNGVRVVWDNTLELAEAPRPAVMARTISLFQA